jgi:hypothetical protein
MLKNKIIIIVVLLFTSIFIYFSYRGFIYNYDDKLFSQWVAAFDAGDLTGAAKIAKKMAWFDEKGSAYYLAHIAIRESIQLNGVAKIEKISNALKDLEHARYSIPGAPSWPFTMLKASLNAFLGNRSKAAEYAEEACKQGKTLSIEECLNGRFSYDDPQGSRWEAIQFYEKASLYNLIGKGNKFESLFYEAVSLKYFDVKEANIIINNIHHDPQFNSKLLNLYCSPDSPADVVFCI